MTKLALALALALGLGVLAGVVLVMSAFVAAFLRAFFPPLQPWLVYAGFALCGCTVAPERGELDMGIVAGLCHGQIARVGQLAARKKPH